MNNGRSRTRSPRGFFGIGIWHGKHAENQGTLWRSAYAFGANFIFTVGARFKYQASDTVQAHRHLPMTCYRDIDDLLEHLPHSCPLVGIELSEQAISLHELPQLERCCYLLGAEDHGLPASIMQRCHYVAQITGAKSCLNVAVAGAIIMHDRVNRAFRME